MRMTQTILALCAALTACAETPKQPADPSDVPANPVNTASVVQREADAAKLDSKKRQRLVALVGETACPCKRGGTLRDCRASCRLAPLAIRTIARGLRRGEPEPRIQARLVERYGPRDPEEIDIGKSPCRGKANAPVTMVLFSDFQCPFCALGRKLIEKVEKRSGDKLRVCFKNYVIHKTARPAALAALAAHRQNKFWPFHDLLFENMREQEQDDLEDYAKRLKLDLARFEKDLADPMLEIQLQKDRSAAIRLKLRGTPAFFINGRPMTDPKTVEDFVDWVQEAVLLKQGPF
jgi:protein-disulfide isomerase